MSTYTQIQIQAVFAVKNRNALIDKSWRERLYQYIVAIMKNRGHKVLAIGGTGDHVHVLFGLNVTDAISNLMLAVKRDSSIWIKENQFITGEFRWQNGYGAFSYNQSQIDGVVKYIKNQETHHTTLIPLKI